MKRAQIVYFKYCDACLMIFMICKWYANIIWITHRQSLSLFWLAERVCWAVDRSVLELLGVKPPTSPSNPSNPTSSPYDPHLNPHFPMPQQKISWRGCLSPSFILDNSSTGIVLCYSIITKHFQFVIVSVYACVWLETSNHFFSLLSDFLDGHSMYTTAKRLFSVQYNNY